jgi:alpha-L-rhamnosidase
VPTGWDRAGFDDSSWDPATVIGRHPTAPWTHLVAQRPRVVEHPVHPRTLKRLRSGEYVADFGRVYAAVPSVRFASGKTGRVLHLRVGYLLDQNGQVSTTLGNQDTDLSYVYTERAGDQTFRPFLYMGFRYLQIDDPGEPLHAADVVAFARHTRVPDEHAGAFSSSNPVLDRVWELGRHTALYGSQEQFVDTPTREKGQFLGDAYYTSFADQRAFGERNLTRQALLEFTRSQARYWPDGRVNGAEPTGEGARDIPDGTEAYPAWVWENYLETGNRELLTEAYPVMKNVADYVARYIDRSTGLVTKIEGGGTDYRYGIVDYPLNMRFGYDMATTARTTINVIGVDVFRRVADAARALGRPAAEVALQADRANTLAGAINDKLRRSDGIYVDGLKANGAKSRHASQHANADALAYDIVPKSDRRRSNVVRYVAKLGMQMGPGTVLDLLRGLDRGGRDADLVKLLSDPKQLGWAQILAKGGTFVWETWQPIDALGDSMSHARGAVVLPAMQEELLGVRVRDPGWARFDVEPPTAGLDHASGRVPTPRGTVRVSWRRSSDDGLTIRLTVPVNAEAVIHLPGRRSVVVGSGVHVLRARS